LPEGRLAAEKLLEKVRGMSFIAAAVLSCGLLVVGIGLSRTLWPKKVPPRTARVASPTKTPSPEGAPVLIGSGPTPLPMRAPEPVTTTRKQATTSTRRKAAAKKTSSPVVVASKSAATNSPEISPATLEIEVTHKFAEAHLSIWLDDRLTYTRVLEGTEKQRLVVFRHVQGHEFHAVQIPAGKHRVKVRLVSGADGYDQTNSVEGNFSSGKETMLEIIANKKGEIQLTLQ